MRTTGLCLVILHLITGAAWGYSCHPHKTKEKLYNDAERAFLVYVTKTELVEDWSRLFDNKKLHKKPDDESVKAIVADYRIIEEFKGDAKYKPRLMDWLGISTGFVGLFPGKYYLVFLAPLHKMERRDIRRIDFCVTPLTHYRLKVDRFQKALDEYRVIRDKHKQ